jgi:hypothetical protein
VNANLMFRQPYGSGEELKAILLSHSPQGYGYKDKGVKSAEQATVLPVKRFAMGFGS